MTPLDQKDFRITSIDYISIDLDYKTLGGGTGF